MAADTNGPGNFCKVGVDREFLSEEAGLRLDGKINLSRRERSEPSLPVGRNRRSLHCATPDFPVETRGVAELHAAL
jgi:hypothetical protein